MFAVTTKQSYWEWLDQGISKPTSHSLKEIQDTFILSELGTAEGKRILEVGGGLSRVAQGLAENNEVWLIDAFEGKDLGPSEIPDLPGIKIVVGYMGQFLTELPDEYFDFAFSVSVIEHVTAGNYTDCFKDIARVLRPGGTTIHAVDMYLFDDPDEHEAAVRFQSRLGIYLDTPNLVEQSLDWQAPPEITTRLAASSRYACNSMATLLGWNRLVPELKEVRANALSCNAQMILVKAS